MLAVWQVIMKFKVLLLIVYLSFIALQAIAISDCDRIISGRILDQSTGEPLPFAVIKVISSDNATISDEEGFFKLENICEDEVDFEVIFIGYKSVIHHHDFMNREHIANGHIVYMGQDESLLEGVVVEGNEIVGGLESLSVQQLGRSALSSKTNQSLAAAIGEIQGVTFTSLGSNVQLPVIHGLYGNRILIINNNVKHGFQNWGDKHTAEIDITSADNISVLKGASGVRYGSEALGGVVVLEGNPLSLSQEAYGGVSAGYQTNGRGYNANAFYGEGKERFSYHVGGSFRRVGDRSAPDYLLYNTGMGEYSVNAGFRYHLPQWDFKAYYSFVDQELGILRPSVARTIEKFAEIVEADEPILMRDFTYSIDEPRQDLAHHLATSEVDWYSSIGKLSLLASYQVNHRKEFDVRRNAELPVIDLTLTTTDNRLEWYHPEFGGMEGTVGLQFFSQNNDNNPGTGSTPFIPNYNNYRTSLFAVESLKKGENTYELGLRLDHEFISVRGRETNQDIFRNEFSYTNLTATFGMVREISSEWNFRSNVGTAWRAPNMAELYSFGQDGFRIVYGLWRYEADEDGQLSTDRVLTGQDREVNAEKGIKWINEFRYQKDRHDLALTGYVNYIDNFIFLRPGGLGSFLWGPGPIYIYDQADALFIGADVTYRHRFTENLKGTLGASYLWSRNVERDEPLINQPPINLNAEIGWDTPSFLGLDQSKLILQTSYTFRQFQAPRTVSPDDLISGEEEFTIDSEIFDFKDAPDGYFLANMLWQWQKGKLGGQLEVRNILNTSYRDYLNQMWLFADDLGRNVLITFNYNF